MVRTFECGWQAPREHIRDLQKQRTKGGQATGDDADRGFYGRPDEYVTLSPANVCCVNEVNDSDDAVQRRKTDTG